MFLSSDVVHLVLGDDTDVHIGARAEVIEHSGRDSITDQLDRVNQLTATTTTTTLLIQTTYTDCYYYRAEVIEHSGRDSISYQLDCVNQLTATTQESHAITKMTGYYIL